MWSPPTPPFWNKVRTGGKEQFSRVNRGRGASLQLSSKGSPPPASTGLPTGRDGLLVLLPAAWSVVCGAPGPCIS